MKGIRLQVNSTFFGVEWAAGQDKTTFVGIVDRWHTKPTVLYVKWDGWNQNKQCPIDSLKADSDGESVDLTLLPYEDGRPAPTLIENASSSSASSAMMQPWSSTSTAHTGEGDQGGEDESTVEISLQNELKPLGMKTMTWTHKKAEGVHSDARQEDRFTPTMNAGFALDDIEAYFYYLYPDEWIDLQLNHTNPRLQGHNKLNQKLEKGELLQFWGYCLALSLHTGLSIECMWSDTPVPDSILPPPRLGLHGTSFAGFKKIRSVLSFGPRDEQSLRVDPWAFVRPLVDQYNAHRQTHFIPGWLMTIDETMVAWRGMVGLLNEDKCPHRSWVPRKPEPLGVELKTVGDSISGVMMRIEICEGKEPMKAKEFSAAWGATTACTMRLMSPWFGSRRVVAGDSWFAGVKTARGLLDNGLHLIGDVKTNSSLFPKTVLEDNTPPGSGEWATYTSMLRLNNGNEVPIFAMSHRRGESIHKFIATCGTTLKGNATKVYFEDDEERANVNLQDFELTRKSPRVLNDYTLAQPCLDR